MYCSDDDRWLDEALFQVIGSKRTEPDFEKWCEKHRGAVEMLTSRASRRSSALSSSLATRRIILRSLITKLAAAAVVIAGVIGAINQIQHTDSSIGVEKVFWHHEFKALDVCSMPVKMEIGSYVDFDDYIKKRIVFKQIDNTNIGKDGSDFPCYLDSISLKVRANFDVKLDTILEKNVGIVGKWDKWEVYYDGSNVVPGDGGWHTKKVCVKDWKTKLWNGNISSEVKGGSFYITAKPDV